MEYYYLLAHMIELENYLEETKLIGVFSSEEKAEAAREFVRDLPGFRDFPDCFYIVRYTPNYSHWSEGFFIERYDGSDEEE